MFAEDDAAPEPFIAMVLWSYRQVIYFFLILIFFIALLIRPDWAHALGPWPALLGLVVLTFVFIWWK